MQLSSCNSTGKCLHGKGDIAGTRQAPSPPVKESWNFPNNVGTTGIFSRKASFFLCCHFSPDCLPENDLLDSRSKLTSPDELVIKLKCTFWILSRGTRSPDMITHGFTNLAMTKPSPSLSCHQVALLTTEATSTAPGTSSSTRRKVRAPQHPPDQTRSPGQRTVPKSCQHISLGWLLEAWHRCRTGVPRQLTTREKLEIAGASHPAGWAQLSCTPRCCPKESPS